MIKPLYFPNTYIQKSIVDCMLTCFEQVLVFKPGPDSSSLMENGEGEGQVVHVLPVAEDEDKLEDFLKEYRALASVHRGRGGQFLKGNVDIPFFDPTWASQLRTEIQIKVENETGDHEGQSDDRGLLLMARAFLQIAQDYDEKNLEISDEIKELERKNRDLFGCLHGGDEGDGAKDELFQAPEYHENDTLETQTEKRLIAWARLFESAWPDPEKTGDGLFITGTRDVLEHIAEHVPGLEHVGDLKLSCESADGVSKLVENLVCCDWDADGDAFEQRIRDLKGNEELSIISLYIYPEKNPYELFSQLSGNKEIHSVKKENRKNIRNTVLGFIEK